MSKLDNLQQYHHIAINKTGFVDKQQEKHAYYMKYK